MSLPQTQSVDAIIASAEEAIAVNATALLIIVERQAKGGAAVDFSAGLAAYDRLERLGSSLLKKLGIAASLEEADDAKLRFLKRKLALYEMLGYDRYGPLEGLIRGLREWTGDGQAQAVGRVPALDEPPKGRKVGLAPIPWHGSMRDFGRALYVVFFDYVRKETGTAGLPEVDFDEFLGRLAPLFALAETGEPVSAETARSDYLSETKRSLAFKRLYERVEEEVKRSGS